MVWPRAVYWHLSCLICTPTGNNQTIHPETRQFINANNTAIARQGKTFEEVEGKVTRALEKLVLYYENKPVKI